MRHRSQESRRKSSVDRINLELEDFKEEIARRFKRSKFNHTYVFPRMQKSKYKSNNQNNEFVLEAKYKGKYCYIFLIIFWVIDEDETVKDTKSHLSNRDSK